MDLQGTTGAFVVPSVPRSVAAVRRYAVQCARELGRDEHAEVLALLVSEVATNAVVHGTGEVQVRVLLAGDRLRVEVADESTRLPTPRTADLEAEGGRGLALVAALAQDWGVQSTAGGKTVWFELS